jgi:hypothetical protein
MELNDFLHKERAKYEAEHDVVIDHVRSSFDGDLTFYASGWKHDDFLKADGTISKEGWIDIFHSDIREEGLTNDEIYEKDVKMLRDGIYQWNWTEVYVVLPYLTTFDIKGVQIFEAFANNFDNDFEFHPRNSIMRYDPLNDLVSVDDIVECVKRWFAKYLPDQPIDSIRYCNVAESDAMEEQISESYSFLKERMAEIKEIEEIDQSEKENTMVQHHDQYGTGGYIDKTFK